MKIVHDLGVVVSSSGARRRKALFLCSCCSKEFSVAVAAAKSRQQSKCNYCNHFIHGACDENLYHVWVGLKQRCNNQKSKIYKDYGGRGVNVCAEWEQDYKVFKSWAIVNGYAKGLTLDRIKNNEGYAPLNCRFADYLVQNNNKRNTLYLTVGPLCDSLANWARFLSVSYAKLYRGHQKYKSDELAILSVTRESVRDKGDLLCA